MKHTALLALILLLFALCCCASSPSGPFEYAEAGFCASVSGSVDGQSFEATVLVSPPSEGASRDVSVEFFLPETMRGITVERRDGKIIAKRGEFTIENFCGEGWLFPLELLIGDGEVVNVERQGEALLATLMRDGQRVRVKIEQGVPAALSASGEREVEIRVTSFAVCP